MTALHRLEDYLAALHRRIRLFAAWRGLAISASSALLLTVILTWIGNQYRLASGVVVPLRLALFAGVACALVFALGRPLLRITRHNTARFAEAKAAEFNQRLITLSEKRGTDNPFHELIAEDAMRVAELHPAGHFVSTRWVAGSLAIAIMAACVLVWLITSAPGYWGYGASLLWAHTPHSSAPLYDIAVTPGDATVRRRTDQVISATLSGFSAQNVVLHAKYKGALKWDALPMQPQTSGSGYQLLFAGLSDSLEYFVEAGASQSKHFTLAVKDLPAVKHLRVSIHFPTSIGLPDAVEDPGGDIRAVEGSKAELKVLTDKPLQNGLIVMDNGSRIPLTANQDNWLTATLPIKTDGSYHIATLDKQEIVRLSDNFIIEARKDEAPVVSILKPGRDAGVSPIEELPITVSSSDDFGLHGVDLHYSVNGNPEQVKQLSSHNNAKQVEGKTTLTLEDFKLAPGDLVSFYATAKDATHTSRSDIVFAKVEPFDLKFRQSQQGSGGSGGGGEQESQISERQKEIIAATWNQTKDPTKEAAAIAQNARFLSDLESKLGDQAKALSERMANRELGQESPQFKDFSKSMLDASAQMAQAVTELKPGKWTVALAPEEKALQSLLHAESVFRDIQVAFGQQAGGRGGGQSGQERDLARLFDLELDTAKNQYESGQSPSGSQDDSQKKLNDELERLKQLAQRQQQLANEQHSPQQQFQQRWEEEQLRREAEQLRQQLQQQLAQNPQQGSPSPSSASSSSQGRASSQGSQQEKDAARRSDRAAQREALKQAMDALSKSEDEMRNASSKSDSSAQQRAASQLAQAQSLMRDMLRQQGKNGLSDLSERARQLAGTQQDLAQRVKKLYGADGVNTARTSEDGTPMMPEMNGPGYGGWYRRRQQPVPDQPATKEEKGLADENDKLAEQLQQLQSQLQQQAQTLTTQQPETARKVRKALSDAEQEEIAVRIRKNSDWLRQGFGSKTWPIEDGITAATQRLSRQLDEARESADKGQTASAPGEEGSLGQALAQVRALREQLQSQRQVSQAPQPQQGQRSPSNSASSGDSPGGQNGDPQAIESQLGGIRTQIGRDDRQLHSLLNDAMGAMRNMKGQAGLLDARLNNNALISLQRLEVELARRLEQKAGARSGAAETVPDGYQEAVATYFRNLSK